MRIGFTGTQRGMTPDQVVMVTHILSENYEEDSVFIHGGCIGADDEAAMVAGNMGYELWCLPSNIRGKHGSIRSHVRFPENDPIARNHLIVQMSQMMVAAPAQEKEVQRSGTWATIRHAHKAGVDTQTVYIDGLVERN